MSPTTSTLRRTTPLAIAILGVILAAFMVLFGASGAANAAAPDTPGGDQKQTDFYFAGVIKFDNVAVPDVTVSVKGNGFDAETATNKAGAWRLYVPAKAKYTITVDETTLPKGVIVDASQLPEGIQPLQGTTASFDAEFGLTGSKILNLFLGEGERVYDIVRRPARRTPY